MAVYGNLFPAYVATPGKTTVKGNISVRGVGLPCTLNLSGIIAVGIGEWEHPPQVHRLTAAQGSTAPRRAAQRSDAQRRRRHRTAAPRCAAQHRAAPRRPRDAVAMVTSCCRQLLPCSAVALPHALPRLSPG
eukprot:gene14197-biopygen14161